MTRKQIQSNAAIKKCVKALNKQAAKASKYDTLRAEVEKLRSALEEIHSFGDDGFIVDYEAFSNGLKRIAMKALGEKR